MIIRRREQLEYLAHMQRSQNLAIVLASGVFDLLHVGHINMFHDAFGLPNLMYGDDRPVVLYVGVNDDISAKYHKRLPIIPQENRAIMLDAIHPIGVVCPFTRSNPRVLLDIIRPDYYIKGEDYNLEDLAEYDMIREHGIKFLTCKRRPGISTTEIIRGAINDR